MGENEEAVRRSSSTHEPCNSEEREIALLLKMWVPPAVGPAAEQKEKKTEDSPPGPPPGEGVALFPPTPEEQSPTSPSCPCQGRLVVFLEDFAAGSDTGGAALLRGARRAGLEELSARGGAGVEDAGGRPRRRAG